MKWLITLLAILAFLHVSAGSPQAVYAASRYANVSVLVDIAPIHDLVSQLTEGIVAPERLLSANQSPHHLQLTPSQVKKISKANIIIMVGDDFVPELDNAVASIAKSTQVIKLLKLPDVGYLPYRNIDHVDEHSHIKEPVDPHFWLDPVLMKQVMKSLADALIPNFPKEAEKLKDNLKKVNDHLDQLHLDIEQTLKAITKPDAAAFTTYHDAYQYFQSRYRITPLMPLLRSPISVVGTKSQLTRMEDIARMPLRCILTEENVPLVARVAEVTKADIVLMNTETGPLNAKSKADYSYKTLLLSVAKTIARCSNPKE